MSSRAPVPEVRAQERRRSLPAPVLIAATALWLALAAGGLGVLARYATAGHASAAAPSEWPVESAIARPNDMACAVVFLHPRCPCSFATLGELSRVIARAPREIHVIVAFFAPSSEAAAWGRTPLRSRAESLPGVVVVDDSDGREARLFGAVNSGHVVAYGPDGSLSFHGGITAARGHEGDNTGSAALLGALSGHVHIAPAPPVYGCAIAPAECALEEMEESP